ncbi:hypothetical protein [Bacteroides caecimuris]|uniref:hypothetical protein n=1 Tax=Bacteroides caecimuris TaxID=1796613 RepID=UPI001C3E3E79|nr:hypothetical protein [Bacteroides caecimuris]
MSEASKTGQVFFNRKGDQGKTGPLVYPAGEYSPGETYTRTELSAPVVLCDGEYYVLSKDGSVTGVNPKNDYAANGANASWIRMQKFQYAFVEVLMANFAKLASAVFSGDFMFSQYGKDAQGKETNEYQRFDPDNYGNSGSPFTPNMLVDWMSGTLRTLKLVANGAKIKDSVLDNVKVTGTIRQPWSRAATYITVGGGNDKVIFDNIASGATGGWNDGSIDEQLTWTLSDSGRVVRIANWKFNGETYDGELVVDVPKDNPNMYFFEDGIQKKKLTLSREIVELIGYGDSTSFFGWIVLNRKDLMTTYRYGRPLKVLAQGIVTGSSAGASVNYKTFDGSGMGVERIAEGEYNLVFNQNWFYSSDECLAIVTGLGTTLNTRSNPCKASVRVRGQSNIRVDTSDDDSRNDGSFMFLIMNMDDWGIT